jgi:hypothetical protein
MSDDAPKRRDYRKVDPEPLPLWAEVLYSAAIVWVAVPVLVGLLTVLVLFLSHRL